MRFDELNLITPLLSALSAEGYENPTPIQAAAIPPVLAGKDLLGCAQTGTGKTAAFALPILQKLAARPIAGGARPVRALVLAPTRELAVQILESFEGYGRNLNLEATTVFGGVGEGPQKAALRRGVDIVVATPGRLLDLLGQRALTLDRLEFLVLDEADRMLDMGFIHDVRRICQHVPSKRQTLLFSATMPDEIRKLAATLLRDPVRVEVARVSSTAENIDQGVYHVPRDSKPVLLRALLQDAAMERVLVFTRTKHGADRVGKALERYRIRAEAIHGNKSQGARQRTLNGFKDGHVRVLVATDLASRGIDVDGVSHVINYDLPQDPETYVHRIGRTARAGATGISMSFCAPEDRGLLKDIERLIKKSIRVLATPALEEARSMEASEPAAEPRREHGRNAPRGQGRPGRRDSAPQARSEGRGESRNEGRQRQVGRSDRSQPKVYLEAASREGGRGDGHSRSDQTHGNRSFGGKRRGKSSRSGGSANREYFSNGR